MCLVASLLLVVFGLSCLWLGWALALRRAGNTAASLPIDSVSHE